MIKHTYKGFGGCVSVCGVDVYQTDAGMIVMLTELEDNPGTSIKDLFEVIATELVKGLLNRHLVSTPETVRWVDHHPGGDHRRDRINILGAASFDEVFMRWSRDHYYAPEWVPLNGDRYATPSFVVQARSGDG